MWAADFAFDQSADRRELDALTSDHLVRILDRFTDMHAHPMFIRKLRDELTVTSGGHIRGRSRG